MTGQVPTIPDNILLLTYVIYTVLPFTSPCGIGEFITVGLPAMQLNVKFCLYTPKDASAGLLIEAAMSGSTATGISKFYGSTTVIRYKLSLYVSVVLFFSSYMPGVEKFSIYTMSRLLRP